MKGNTFFKSSLIKMTIFICTILSAIMVSCTDDDVVFHKYVTINHKGWDTCTYVSLKFVPDSNMTDRNMDVFLELRTKGDYQFANLWLEVSDNISNPDVMQTDTIEVRTADDNGLRYGTFTAGLYSLSFPYQRYNNVRNGEITIRIRHLMNHSPLKGLNDVGVCIRHADMSKPFEQKTSYGK